MLFTDLLQNEADHLDITWVPPHMPLDPITLVLPSFTPGFILRVELAFIFIYH